uniref:Radical SAM protein n=1 Tax=candidate division WOR-3 bacterium TaxID=2052148 RepID=A0A7V5XZ22_UNCW3
MGTCRSCNKRSRIISKKIGYCADCLRKNFPLIKEEIKEIHKNLKKAFSLPEEVPHSLAGKKCGQCVNDCRMLNNELGYCGLIKNEKGIIKRSTDFGYLDFYYDPLPTNCVASFICPGREKGYNLAIFFRHCSFNCLYCQNWHFRLPAKRRYSIAEMVAKVNPSVFCVCYFGGDPTPNINYVIKLSEKILAKQKCRLCLETNGSLNLKIFKKVVDLALKSGGIIKIDLKAFSKEIHYTLTGSDNQNTLRNIEYCAQFFEKRKEPPLLVVATLLVPGYVDFYEIENIVKFISQINPEIPLSFLAYYPTFYLNDLPRTSQAHAELAKKIALKYGLKKVNIGNSHLLSNDYFIDF